MHLNQPQRPGGKKINLMGSTYHSLNNSVMGDDTNYPPAKTSIGDQTPNMKSSVDSNILTDLLKDELEQI
jgi:hypothetical protein